MHRTRKIIPGIARFRKKMQWTRNIIREIARFRKAGSGPERKKIRGIAKFREACSGSGPENTIRSIARFSKAGSGPIEQNLIRGEMESGNTKIYRIFAVYIRHHTEKLRVNFLKSLFYETHDICIQTDTFRNIYFVPRDCTASVS